MNGCKEENRITVEEYLVLIKITDEEQIHMAKNKLASYYMIDKDDIQDEKVYLRFDIRYSKFEYVLYIDLGNPLFYEIGHTDELSIPIYNIDEVVEISNSLM